MSRNKLLAPKNSIVVRIWKKSSIGTHYTLDRTEWQELGPYHYSISLRNHLTNKGEKNERSDVSSEADVQALVQKTITIRQTRLCDNNAGSSSSHCARTIHWGFWQTRLMRGCCVWNMKSNRCWTKDQVWLWILVNRWSNWFSGSLLHSQQTCSDGINEIGCPWLC